MASCSNCKRNLSCGCQKKRAKDGTSVCSNCIATYEAKLYPKPAVKTVTSVQAKPQVWGKNRYRQT
jgi:hypothetical protein